MNADFPEHQAFISPLSAWQGQCNCNADKGKRVGTAGGEGQGEAT